MVGIFILKLEESYVKLWSQKNSQDYAFHWDILLKYI